VNDKKDYLYYFWQNHIESWLCEFAYLAKDKDLKGLTFGGLTDGRKLINLADFNLEELMCAQDIIKGYFYSPSGRYNKFNEDYTSYELKHMVERLLNKITHGRINYVSNGTVILAMHHCGFKFQRIPGTPNCYFNVPKNCYKRMEDALQY
jgi:hypothetical protein